MILCANPKFQYLSKKKLIISSVLKTLNSNKYVIGENVVKFEKEFSKFIGVNYSASVANGTDAIELGLKALGITAGDEVITVSHTALATVAAICSVGAKPILIDINEKDYLIDHKLIEKNINKISRFAAFSKNRIFKPFIEHCIACMIFLFFIIFIISF